MDIWLSSRIEWLVAHPEKVGLALNLAGTILIALAIGRNRGAAYQFDERGRRQYLAAVLHPSWFKFGLLLIGAGFVLQLVG